MRVLTYNTKIAYIEGNIIFKNPSTIIIDNSYQRRNVVTNIYNTNMFLPDISNHGESFVCTCSSDRGIYSTDR